MPQLCVHLFGGFSALRGDQAIPAPDGARVQELFCYLLLHRGRPHAREALAGQFWSESTTAQSLKALRQALWQLQAWLAGQGEVGSVRVVLAESEGVRINGRADLWVDVAEFEQAHAASCEYQPAAMPPPLADRLGRAADLYRGELLDHWYQEWCLVERERLHDHYLAMLDRLMGYSEAHETYEAGIEYGARALQCERACERTHRRLMRLHYLAGDRTGALRQYERCAAALQEELGVSPGRTTCTLREHIRGDYLEAPEPEPDSPDAPVELRSRLQQLCDALDRARGEVQRSLSDLSHPRQ